MLSVTVPCVLAAHDRQCSTYVSSTYSEATAEHIVHVDKYSSLKKLVRATSLVLKFVNILKSRISKGEASVEAYMYEEALKRIILIEQKMCFPEVFHYFQNPKVNPLPSLLTHYNLIMDSDSILRVKSKFKNSLDNYPVLLPNSSVLTELIISNEHFCINHGIYSVLRSLRTKFWILKSFFLLKQSFVNVSYAADITPDPLNLI